MEWIDPHFSIQTDTLAPHKPILQQYQKKSFTPKVAHNVDFETSHSPGVERPNLAHISNMSDNLIVSTAGAFASSQNHIVSHLGYVSFKAEKNISSCLTLLSLLAQKIPAFPLNPKLPDPQLPIALPHCNAATLLLTSGTTGTPKIAVHSLDNHLYATRGIDLTRNDKWLLTLPLFHVSGMAILFRTAVFGATLVLSELPLLDAIIQHRISHISLVPTQLYRLLQEDPHRLAQAKKHLQLILLGGAPIPKALLEEARACALPIVTTYGMTETCSFIAIDGVVAPGRTVTLIDGEIGIAGPTLFQGYLENHALHLPLQNGYFLTKDLGCWKDERLSYKGRKDRLFISGGENIQPEEIEAILTQLTRGKARVIPIECPEFGMRPFAFLEYPDALCIKKLRSLLPQFKVPVGFQPLLEPLPK